MTPVLFVYGAGVLVGLWRTDAGLPTRVALSLLWPIGPLAFVVTMTGLAGLKVVTSPAASAVAVVAAVAAWWIMR